MGDDNLYVIKRTYVDFKDPAEPATHVALPATFTDLKEAKIAAKSILIKEGYEPEFFAVYEVKDGSKEWKHGDGVIVFAKDPAGETFKVEIDTVYNALKLKAGKGGRVPKPLYHIVQTLIDYNDDRGGARRETMVEDVETDCGRARHAAFKVLLDEDMKKENYVEYDEYNEEGVEGPFGPEVLVHAVREGGQNVLVSVIAEK